MAGKKSFGDYVTDWLKVMLKGGVPLLFVGGGWILILVGSVSLGASARSNPAFWVDAVVAVMMMWMGYSIWRREKIEPERS